MEAEFAAMMAEVDAALPLTPATPPPPPPPPAPPSNPGGTLSINSEHSMLSASTAAADSHRPLSTSEKVYFSDGSVRSKQRSTGSAVVWMEEGRKKPWRAEVAAGTVDGPDSVRQTEVAAVGRALEWAVRHVQDDARQYGDASVAGCAVRVWTDSLDAIRDVGGVSFRLGLGYPTNELVKLPAGCAEVQSVEQAVRTLVGMGCRVVVSKVPGHAGCKGNEIADAVAKLGSQWGESAAEVAKWDPNVNLDGVKVSMGE